MEIDQTGRQEGFQERPTVKDCICNIGWGVGDAGLSICGATCPIHPPDGNCPKCGKYTFENLLCCKCEYYGLDKTI